MPEYPDAPDNEVSVSELMKELRKREVRNRANNEKRESLNWSNNQVCAQTKRVEEITEKIAQLKRELGEEKGKLEQLCQSQSKLKSEITSLQDANVQEVREQIAGADAINRKVRSNHEHAKRKQLLDEKQSESISLSAEIQDIDETKAKALSDAKFPIAGLSFAEALRLSESIDSESLRPSAEGQPFAGDRRSAVTASTAHEAGVTYNNIPFNQCSSSEQLRVSLVMGLAMNPKLKVILIRDGCRPAVNQAGSLLDKDNFTMIAEMAAVADAQVWVEKVGEDEDVSIRKPSEAPGVGRSGTS